MICVLQNAYYIAVTLRLRQPQRYQHSQLLSACTRQQDSPAFSQPSIVLGCYHGDRDRVTDEVDTCVFVFPAAEKLDYTEVCIGCQADGKLCFLSDREMEGSVLSVAIIDGRVWLEGLNSLRPLETQIRFVSKDFSQMNVSSPLALTESVNRSIRTNSYKTKKPQNICFLHPRTSSSHNFYLCFQLYVQ